MAQTTTRTRPRAATFRSAVPLLGCALCAGGAGAQGAAVDGEATPPRLVVVVVVDQMRHDILERFDDQLTGGLRRLLDEGAVYTRARHLHGVPHTAPGHATLATGTHPSSHGLVGNSWVDRQTGASVYAVADASAGIPGDSAAPGRSPANLLRPAFGTALRAGRPGARVVAVAGKDRSAVAMAGHDSDGAYWFDRLRGRFVTSSYWAQEQPAWLESGALRRLADSLAAEPWSLLLPEAAYDRSREDAFPPEGAGADALFPHRPAGSGTGPDGWAPGFSTSPFLDVLTFEAARAAVEAHGLGEDEVPDLLWVGASAADFIGHEFGPYSREVQDHFLRLDRALGSFLDWLDARLGRRYVVALSADHGVLPMPEELARRGLDAGRIDMDATVTALRTALDSAAAAEGVSGRIPAALVVLEAYLLFPPGLAADVRGRIRAAVADAVRRVPGVADVVTTDDLGSESPPLLADFYRRSYHPDRSPDLWIRPRDGWLLLRDTGLTAHIAPYDYDLRVPLLLAGPGIRPGRYGREVATVDLVPTLARLLGVDPGPAEGTVLVEALAERAASADRG